MLKHMPPGPTSGQPRPPTRGHLHRPAQPLNVSALSIPVAQAVGSGTSGVSSEPPKLTANGGPHLSSLLNTIALTPIATNTAGTNNHNYSNNNSNLVNSTSHHSTLHHHHHLQLNNNNNTKHRVGAREALTSLGLLCLVSLLLALLSLIFLLKISPGRRELPPPPPVSSSPEDYIIVYDVTLALCALSLSLNLCCLLVCAIQFLFAVKLVRAPAAPGRGNKYLQKSSVSRVCAVGGFFISIPIFLTGIILYTFTQFHSTPAIITSVLIGVGIVFCGGAMVHNVFVWQKEKTICVRYQTNPLNMTLTSQIPSAIAPPSQFTNHSSAAPNHLHLLNSTANNHISTSAATPGPPVVVVGGGSSIGGVGASITSPHATQLSHPKPVTPITTLSPNHSHVNFNHSYVPIPTYGLRTATATPPTPKVTNGFLGGRDAASGSISPGIPANVLDASNATNISPHELSTLV